MKIKYYYNKNLKMSEGKLAAQIGHVCFNIGTGEGFVDGLNDDYSDGKQLSTIVVLDLRQNKFKEKMTEVIAKYDTKYIQVDWGLTEVDKDTITAFGHV